MFFQLNKFHYEIILGEVIHQPLNVVKELIENSLDAQSTHIIVTLKDGGFGEVMIRVR